MARMLRSPAACVALALLLIAFMCSPVAAVYSNLGRVYWWLGNGRTSGAKDGTGTGASGALLNSPNGCALDKDENMFLLDTANYVVRKVNAKTAKTTVFAGEFGENGDIIAQSGKDARFATPEGLAFLADGVTGFLTDSGNHRIYSLNARTSAIGYFAGDGRPGNDNGVSEEVLLNGPSGITIIHSTNDMFVTERFGHRVRKISIAAVSSLFAGSGNSVSGDVDALGGDARFKGPTGITLIQEDGRLFMSDTDNRKVKRITKAGLVTTLAGSGSSGTRDGTGTAVQFGLPRGVSIDRRAAYVYVMDGGNNVVRRVDVFTGFTDTVVGTLVAGWTTSLSSTRAQIAGGRGLCAVIGEFASKLYMTGDHSVSYLEQHYTRTITEEFDIENYLPPPVVTRPGQTGTEDSSSGSSAVATAGAATVVAGVAIAIAMA